MIKNILRSDHSTYGTGSFMYLDATANEKGMISTLRSPPLFGNVRQCLSFSAVVPSGSLEVYSGVEGHWNQVHLVHVQPDFSRGWVLVQVQISGLSNDTQYVRIKIIVDFT